MPGNVLPIKKWRRHGNVGVADADASGMPGLPLGTLSYLPLEIRDEIWRHVLLLDRNVSYPELRVNRRGTQIPPDRIYDFDLNLFRVSKAIYEETSRVFYDENLFIRLQLHDYGKSDRWLSVLRQNFHHSTLSYFTSSQLKHSRHHAMDVDIYQTARAAIQDSGKLITYMIPFSRLSHLLGCLTTMAIHCVFDDQHFTREHGIALTIRSKRLTNSALHAKLLDSFTASFGFRNVEVTGVSPDLAATTMSTVRSAPLSPRFWLTQITALYNHALYLERTLYDRPHIIWRALSEIEHHINLLVRDSYASPRTAALLQLSSEDRQKVQDMLFWTNLKRAQYFAKIGWKCENGWGDRCYKAAAATVALREMIEGKRAYLDVGESVGSGRREIAFTAGNAPSIDGEDEDLNMPVAHNVWIASGPKKEGYEYADDQKFALYCLNSRFMLGSGKVRDAQRSLKIAAECLAALGEPLNLAREYRGVEEEVNAKGYVLTSFPATRCACNHG